MIQPFLVFSDWGILILRVVLGLILLVHGWPKIKNLKATGEGFQAMGFKPAIFLGVVVAVIEFFGGLALILGLLTQIIALLVAVQFLVAILKVKAKRGLVNGYEFDLLILAAALALAALGGGVFSADSFLGLILY